MNVTCKDRDRIFEDGTPAEWAALEGHATTCSACTEELRAWRSISLAAAELRDYAESPALWPKIHHALTEHAAGLRDGRKRWSWRWLFPTLSLSWRTATGALALIFVVSVGWFLSRPTNDPPQLANSLLKSKTLKNVERAQAVYIEAIDKLAVEAKPQLDDPATPLLTSYREKLFVLDSGINDLRAQTGQNPSNAHLRYELLAMYQEKRRTLEEVLEQRR